MCDGNAVCVVSAVVGHNECGDTTLICLAVDAVYEVAYDVLFVSSADEDCVVIEVTFAKRVIGIAGSVGKGSLFGLLFAVLHPERYRNVNELI